MSQQTHLRAVAFLIAMVIAIVAAALAPFRFAPDNHIAWLDQRPGIRIEANSLAHTGEALDWSGGRSFSLELWLEPGSVPSRRLARILAIRDSEDLPQLSADQWRSILIVRDRFRGRDGKLVYREHAVYDALQEGRARYLALTSDPSGSRAYVDGVAAELQDKPAIIGESEPFGGQLLIGNASRGNQSWEGELYGVAIYDRALDAEEIADHARSTRAGGPSALAAVPGLVALYSFEEGSGERASGSVAGAPELLLPRQFQPLRRTVLHLPGADDTRRGWFRQDLLLNILGFLPLGFALALVLRRRGEEQLASRLARTVIYAAGLSLAIELTQSLIPSRVSSTVDLVANAAGGGLGALLEALWNSRRPESRRA